MRALVACEESQRVTIELRKRGWEAYSCDIQEPSGGHPEWHIQGDVIPLLNGRCEFVTADGDAHQVDKWDLLIAHPPCTYLTVSGNRWFNVEVYGDKARERERERERAVEFFMRFVNAPCEHIAVENPVGYMGTHYRKADQIIHPWQFSDAPEERVTKQTCLWLKGLPPLAAKFTEKPEIEYKEWYDERAGRWKRQSMWYYKSFLGKAEDRQRERSKTFFGIARAMAEQWTEYILNGDEQIRMVSV